MFVVLGENDQAERVAYYAGYSEKRLRAELKGEGVSFLRITPVSALVEKLGERETGALIKLIEALSFDGSGHGIDNAVERTFAFFFDQGRLADRELDES